MYEPMTAVRHSPVGGLPGSETTYTVDRVERVPAGLRLWWHSAWNLLAGGVVHVLVNGKLTATYELGPQAPVAAGWQKGQPS